MNFAVPALLIFLLVLPGIVFRYAYARGPRGWTSPTSLRAISDEIALGVLAAALLHTVWLGLITHLPWLERDVRYDDWLFVLLGNPARDSGPLTAVIGRASDNIAAIAGYFLSINLLAVAAGMLVHHTVRRRGWDRSTRLLRFDNPWHYLLSSEIEEFPDRSDKLTMPSAFLSAVVEQGKEPYVYRGIVEHFFYGADGQLDRVLMSNVSRWKLTDGADSDKYDIRGNYFVLRYSETRTLNIEYFLLSDADDAADTEPSGSEQRAEVVIDHQRSEDSHQVDD
ncbi:hypothetical protein [Nevskia sp.]|uniref:DUF6338 family protein n=1 Tax=Nevskia sp. TaxID=1929292 RepID=UPI0025FC1961|nr:hypothetical protein [Nevskia sp.]